MEFEGEFSVFVGVSGEHRSIVSIEGDTRSMVAGIVGIVPIDFIVGVLGIVPTETIFIGVLGIVPVDVMMIFVGVHKLTISCSCSTIVSIK